MIVKDDKCFPDSDDFMLAKAVIYRLLETPKDQAKESLRHFLNATLSNMTVRPPGEGLDISNMLLMYLLVLEAFSKNSWEINDGLYLRLEESKLIHCFSSDTSAQN